MLSKLSTYKAHPLYFNRHLETIIPALLRKVKGIKYERERISTPDGDFLDLDWIKNSNDRVVIISHGLEGASDRAYMKGMVKIFSENGYDTLAWNYRGCSGEMNNQPRFYHSGATEDLKIVVDHAGRQYSEINLIGFSLGGNLTLKYLGEKSNNQSLAIKRAAVFSVPMDLHSSCIQISKWYNYPYSKRFLINLKKKVIKKALIYSDKINTNGINKINNLLDFDDHFTAPMHGFEHAIDYYQKCSSINFIKHINTETLIVNAQNDSFLSKKCYPYEELSKHSSILFETPKKGGHCGFPGADKDGYYWSEKRALEFISSGL